MQLSSDIVGAFGRIVLTLLGKTWRIRRLRPSTGIRGDSILYAFWHGVQLPLIYTHRNMGIRVLISSSRDGTFVSSVCERMGYRPVRGSSSKGGGRAALELARSLRDGDPCAITPDGPRGPAQKIKKGVALIPGISKRPVVPYGVSSTFSLRLNSWDRFLIPLPFSSVHVAEGRPVPHEYCSEDILTAALQQQQHRAELSTSTGAGFMIKLLKLAGWILTPAAFLVLASRHGVERRERKGHIRENCSRPVWLHGASLGELKGLMPVVDYLRKLDIPVHITCTTCSGRDFLGDLGVSFSLAPLDLPGYVNRFLDNLSPRALILAETEFWPLLLHETALRGIPSAVINGKLSGSSVKRYALIKPLFTGVMKCFRKVYARSEEDRRRFITAGVQAESGGDWKALVKPPEPDPHWIEMISRRSRGILVAGSTRKGEEEQILRIARRTELTPVLVPRHGRRVEEVMKLALDAGYEPDLWTDNPANSDCMIVNVEGILPALYGLADIAFIGGTLAQLGGHNIMEPLAHGVPVLSGPHHDNIMESLNTAVEQGRCAVFSTVEEGAEAAIDLLERQGLDTSRANHDCYHRIQELIRVLEIHDSTG